MDEVYAWNQQDIDFSFFNCDDHPGNKTIAQIEQTAVKYL